MTAVLEARVAQLEAIVGRQAAALARLEGGALPPPAATICGLNPIKRRKFERTLDLVAAAFHVDRAELIGPSREGRFIQARFAAVWLFRQLDDMSMARLGTLFGRDHSTILYALRRADGWREADPDFAAATDRMLERLRAECAEWRP